MMLPKSQPPALGSQVKPRPAFPSAPHFLYLEISHSLYLHGSKMELINFLTNLPLCLWAHGTQLESSASSGLLGSTFHQPVSCLLSPVVSISLLPLTSTLLPIPISYLAAVLATLPANSSLQSLSKVRSHVILLFKNLEQLYMAC